MHGADREVSLLHLLSEPVNLPLGVAEDDCLGDRQCVIQVTEGIKLPLLTLYSYKELLDAFQCQLVTVKENQGKLFSNSALVLIKLKSKS